MRQLRIGRIVGTAVLALGALATTGCLGDSDPVDVELTDVHVVGVAIRLTQQFTAIPALGEGSANEDLLALTDSMIAHHEAHLDALVDLGLSPRATDLSEFLAQQIVQAQNILAPLQGEEHDAELLEILEILHENALDYIDEQLLPTVQGAELEAELNAMFDTISADLVEIRNVQAGIEAPAT